MKLQAASKKEISRIAVGTLACDVIMIAGLFLLSQFGIGKFDILRILLGAACGSVVAILNFTILCLTVQNAVEIDSKKKMRQKFQMSYNVRLLLQAVWVVAAYLIPQVHFVAGALPVQEVKTAHKLVHYEAGCLGAAISCNAGASLFPMMKCALPVKQAR